MIFLLSQRECGYFYKKKTKTTKKISGNMCWGFTRERGLWKYICKYKGKWRKHFWQIRGKAETYRGNKRKWTSSKTRVNVKQYWRLVCMFDHYQISKTEKKKNNLYCLCIKYRNSFSAITLFKRFIEEPISFLSFIKIAKVALIWTSLTLNSIAFWTGARVNFWNDAMIFLCAGHYCFAMVTWLG